MPSSGCKAFTEVMEKMGPAKDFKFSTLVDDDFKKHRVMTQFV